jgi:hypothetical protein
LGNYARKIASRKVIFRGKKVQKIDPSSRFCVQIFERLRSGANPTTFEFIAATPAL